MYTKRRFRDISKKKAASASALGILGFILSPLSWWNDFLVNVPLALMGAVAISWLLNGIIQVHIYLFLALVVFFYWCTNVLGMWMMLKGYTVAKKEVLDVVEEEVEQGTFIQSQFVTGTVYTLVIVGLSLLLTDFSIAEELQWLPSWVVA